MRPAICVDGGAGIGGGARESRLRARGARKSYENEESDQRKRRDDARAGHRHKRIPREFRARKRLHAFCGQSWMRGGYLFP